MGQSTTLAATERESLLGRTAKVFAIRWATAVQRQRPSLALWRRWNSNFGFQLSKLSTDHCLRFTLLLYFAYRGDDRGMILVEPNANLRKGALGQLSTKEHVHLAGMSDLLRTPILP